LSKRDYFLGGAFPLVAPADGEPVITKTEPNGFVGTDLARAAGRGPPARRRDDDQHVRRRYRPGHDRPRTERDSGPPRLRSPGSEFENVAVPRAMVHAAFMPALADGYAEVVRSTDLLAR